MLSVFGYGGACLFSVSCMRLRISAAAVLAAGWVGFCWGLLFLLPFGQGGRSIVGGDTHVQVGSLTPRLSLM